MAAEAPDYASPPLAWLAVQGHGAEGASITPSHWTARGLDAFGDHAIFGAYLAGDAAEVAVVGGRPHAHATLAAAAPTDRLLLVVLGGTAALKVAGAAAHPVRPGDVLVLETGTTPLTIGPHGMLGVTVELPPSLAIATAPAPTTPAPTTPAATGGWPKAPDSLMKLTDHGVTDFHYFRMETGADGSSHVAPAAWSSATPDPTSTGLVDFFHAPAKHLNLVSAKPSYQTPPHNVGAAAELDVVLRGSSTGVYGNGRTQDFRVGDMVLIDDKGSKGRAVRIGADGYLALSVNLAH